MSLLTLLLRLLLLPLAIFRWVRRLFVRVDHKSVTPPGFWQNCVANQFTKPTELARPQSIEELRALLAVARDRAKRSGHALRVRAVGAGHSFSDVAVCDDLLIDPHALCHFRVLDASRLRAGKAEDGSPLHFVDVGAGIRIRDLNQQLLLHELALTNMGAYDIQTISGAISTGTHGSGITLGPLCDAVRSLDVLTNEEYLRIEPQGGLSDPLTYASENPDGPRLVQDDDLFYSAVVAMGSMGIICGYTLEVRAAYRLRETRSVAPWSDVRRRLLAGEFKQSRHYEVYINPYVVKGGEPQCLVTRRDEYTGPSVKSVGARTRNPVATFVTSIRAFDAVFVFLFTRLPWLAPYMIQASLDGLADREYIDQSFKVLYLGDANLVPAYSSEFAFDASDGAEPPDFIRATDDFLTLAGEQRQAGRWHSSPISLRFVAASRHYLAPQYGRPTCMMEIPFLDGTPSGWQMLAYYERRLAKHDLRPHWGQAYSQVSAASVARLYPRFSRWLSAFKALNPHGTFDNPFTERLSLRLHQELVELRLALAAREETKP